MNQQQELLKAILYSALASPLGLLLRTSDQVRARAGLYKARADAQDPSLSILQIRVSPWPGEGDLVICKGSRPKTQLANLDFDPLSDLDL